MARLVLASGALSGTVVPGALTLAVLLAGVGAWFAIGALQGEAPPLAAIPAVTVEVVEVGEITKRRAGKWATEPVSHGFGIAYSSDADVPESIRNAAVAAGGYGTVLRVDELLSDQGLPPADGQYWTLSVLDGKVVHIVDGNRRERTSYAAFAAARHARVLRHGVLALTFLGAGAALAVWVRRHAERLAAATEHNAGVPHQPSL